MKLRPFFSLVSRNSIMGLSPSVLQDNSLIPLPIKDQQVNNNNSPIPSLMQDQGTDNNVQNNSLENNHSLLLIFNVVLLLAIVLLLILYYNTARKLNKMVKLQKIPILTEEKEDLERSFDEKKIEIGEGTKMAVEERKELIFFRDKPRFQMGQLLKASAEVLGQGIMGNSYKARLHDGPNIVVKRLRDLKPLSERELAMQLGLIADMKHPNLLPLLAYYLSRDEKLLLYRYAENGNLFSRLHDGRDGNRVPFKWNSRLSVAKGVARALEYLHKNTTTIVPHGNLKTSNILLDENDVVLVSDYCLSPLIAQPIAVQRMVAYKSPEYSHARKVSPQSDVWSYGCLLIELLTGKISAYSAPQGSGGGVDLCSWAQRAVREEWTAEIFDKEIYREKNGCHEGMVRLFQIAMRCIERLPENRPGMSEVVREVEKIEAVPVVMSSKLSLVDDEDQVSLNRSITDDSYSTTTTSTSGIIIVPD